MTVVEGLLGIPGCVPIAGVVLGTEPIATPVPVAEVEALLLLLLILLWLMPSVLVMVEVTVALLFDIWILSPMAVTLLLNDLFLSDIIVGCVCMCMDVDDCKYYIMLGFQDTIC